MTDLENILNMYRRRGFENLSEQERHVLQELELGALVEMQKGFAVLIEAHKALTGLTDEVKALKVWKEVVEDPVNEIIKDKAEWKEGKRKLGWTLAERAVLAILGAIVAALLLLLGLQASGAGLLLPVQIPGLFSASGRDGQHVQEQGDDVEREEAGVGGRAGVLLGPLRYGLHPEARIHRVQFIPTVQGIPGHFSITRLRSSPFEDRERPDPLRRVYEPRHVGHAPEPVASLRRVPERVEPREPFLINEGSPAYVSDLVQVEGAPGVGDGSETIRRVIPPRQVPLLEGVLPHAPILHKHGVKHLQAGAMRRLRGVGHDLGPAVHRSQEPPVLGLLIHTTATA